MHQAEIQKFVFPVTNQEVRITDRNGEPWWVAKDVCEVLDIGNSRMALSRLDDDEKGVISIDTLGGNQEVSIINEAGLYSLILTSRKPEAKEFKRWVTHEVLPTIRKTGGYQTPGVNRIADLLDDPKQANSLMLELMVRREKDQETIAQLNGQVSDLKPKAEALNRLESAEGSLCIRDAAKSLGVQEKSLFSYLRTHSWIYQRPGCVGNLAHADKIRSGVMEHKTTELTKPDGTSVVRTQPRVTAKGLVRLAKELNGPLFN